MKIIKVFIAFCAAAIVGIAALVVGACGTNGAFDGAVDISEITKDSVKHGQIVTGEVYDIWDRFAVQEKEEDGETITVAGYYTMLMPYSYHEEAPVFIGISSTIQNEIDGLEQMRSEIEGIVNDEASADGYTKMKFRGKIARLDDTKLLYLKVSVAQLLGITENEAENYIAPYVIESYNGSDFLPVLIAGIVLTIVGISGALILFFKDAGDEN